MEKIQGWVDATRAWVDPLYGMMAVVALGLLLVWLLNRPPTIRERKTMGGHYLGKITPKTLPKMLQDAPMPEEEPLFADEDADPQQKQPRPEMPDPDPEVEDALRRMRLQRQKNPPRRMR